jgi:hypothetical protein
VLLVHGTAAPFFGSVYSVAPLASTTIVPRLGFDAVFTAGPAGPPALVAEVDEEPEAAVVLLELVLLLAGFELPDDPQAARTATNTAAPATLRLLITSSSVRARGEARLPFSIPTTDGAPGGLHPGPSDVGARVGSGRNRRRDAR